MSHTYFVLCYHSWLKQNADFPTLEVVDVLIRNLPQEPAAESAQTEVAQQEGLRAREGQALQEESKKNLRNCEQYFDLLCGLMSLLGDRINQSNAFDFRQVFLQVYRMILRHKTTETLANGHTDNALTGLLNFCKQYVKLYPAIRVDPDFTRLDALQTLFRTCLFYVDSAEHQLKSEPDAAAGSLGVKCISQSSREAGYKLMFALAHKNASFTRQLINECLLPVIEQSEGHDVRATDQFSLFSHNQCRSPLGFCGIYNMGCICYMNSMLQQFFHVPQFRNAILLADDGLPENIQVTEQQKRVDDNVLHQLQKMFAFLQESERQDYNPEDFCFSFKDFENNPTNFAVQQDAQEFLNMIVDKIENGLRNTPYKQILDGIFGGKTCSTLACQNCGLVRKKYEHFFNLSLPVKNIPSLSASLQQFIAGETISDYKCEGCNQKVDIKKRVCLHELPNVLVVHLQRIIFDLDLSENTKINTRFEFPKSLNLEPYTTAGLARREKKDEPADQDAEPADQKPPLTAPQKQDSDLQPREYYEYKLVGVVVHVGTAEFGHYYSFINTNRSEGHILRDEGAENWLEFNDSRVKTFNIDHLENECFGGSTANQNQNYEDSTMWSGAYASIVEKRKSAYLLVYERRLKSPLSLKFTQEDAAASALSQYNIRYQIKVEQEPKEEKPVKEELPAKEDKPHIDKEPRSAGKSSSQQEVSASVNYYDLLKVALPKRLADLVHRDNYQFMFDQQINSTEFFLFLRRLSKLAEAHASQAQSSTRQNLPQEAQKPEEQIMGAMVGFYYKLIISLIQRNYDENRIMSLQEKMMQLICITPE